MKGMRDSEVTDSVLDMHALSSDLQENTHVVLSVSKITQVTYPLSETSLSVISLAQFYETSIGRPLLCDFPMKVTECITDHGALLEQAKATGTDGGQGTQVAPNT